MNKLHTLNKWSGSFGELIFRQPIWLVALIVVIGSVNCAPLSELIVEAGSKKSNVTPSSLSVPVIQLSPTAGGPGTVVTVTGQGWQPADQLYVGLQNFLDSQKPQTAYTTAVVTSAGSFTASFMFPSETYWTSLPHVLVTARSSTRGDKALAVFQVLAVIQSAPTFTPTPDVLPTDPPSEPTAAATPGVQAPTLMPPALPLATATTDVNIRSGPGTEYALIGLLKTGQSAEVTGVSPDSGWWQVKFSGAEVGRGWVSAKYVNLQNISNVAVVRPSVPAPTPTPVPTLRPEPTLAPPVISDWRGEYYNNNGLNGSPVLVRNDAAINFNWGSGSPGAGLPADNFSVRWTRTWTFDEGLYLFRAHVDDGLRLYLNNSLVIDEWRDGGAREVRGEFRLPAGTHNLRLEYYERSGDALSQLWWEKVSPPAQSYPDWKAEYFDNRKLQGNPILVRNETKIEHKWGSGTPGAGVPADNFSVRWTRKVNFEDGLYTVRVKVDDGVRLWLDDDLVIESWQDGNTRLLESTRRVSQGRHRVKVEYYERTGEARIEVKWVKLCGQPLLADPGGPYTVDEGSLITFKSRTTAAAGCSVSYEWDFDLRDNIFTVDAIGPTASTIYADGPAVIFVALRLTDETGASSIATTSVTVNNAPPTVDAGGPYDITLVGSPVTLAGTATDPGSIDRAGLSYRWDFGDGTFGDGPIVSHTYQQAALYSVILTVTDKDGAQGRDTATVPVVFGGPPLQAVISSPANGLAGEPINFSGRGSSGNIASYLWEFGDGTTGSGVDLTHTYSLAASYQVTLTVTGQDNSTAKAVHTIIIDVPVTVNLPPTAVINGPERGQVGEGLKFSGSDSGDPDGTIDDYAWNFGDEMTDHGVNATHAYNEPGDYRVTLTVTDNGGLANSHTWSVRVEAANQAPRAEINGPESGQVGEGLQFSGSGSSDPNDPIADYVWDFGDGNAASGVDVNHGFSAGGIYHVVLTVTDSGGLSQMAKHSVQIDEPMNLPPTVDIDVPVQG